MILFSLIFKLFMYTRCWGCVNCWVTACNFCQEELPSSTEADASLAVWREL